MKRLCFISNIAPRYRQPIFSLMDNEWNIDWYFGKNDTDIAGIPDGVLKSVTYVPNRKVFGPFYHQKGLSRLINEPVYSGVIALGEPFCLSTWSLLIRRRLFNRDKKVFLWSHGWYGREGTLKRIMKRLFFGMADHVLIYSNYGRSVAISQGFPERRISVIYNSLDFDRHVSIREMLGHSDLYREMFGNEDPVLLFIGRLTKVKRLDLLIGSMSILADRGEHYNLILIGDGTERRSLEKLAEKNGLSDRIRFYGESYEEVKNAQLLYDADLCVSPGNVGLTAIHALTFGLPVVTHDGFSWQMPEFEAVVPGETGLFFKRDDETSLADTISQWFAGTGKDREAVRKACYNEIAAHWTPAAQMDILHKLL